MKEIARVVDLRDVLGDRRWAVVGDVHGCSAEFHALLGKIGWTPDDILISTGDLIDRGPQSVGVLSYFMARQATHFAVEGNHESRLKRALRGNPVQIKRGLAETLVSIGDRIKPSISAWLDSLPQIIRVPDAEGIPQYVVHAGIDPGLSIDQQEAETCRYVRFLGGHNFLDCDHGQRWYRGMDGRLKIIFGHHVHQAITPNPHVVALDGGCCVGGELRALVTEGTRTRVVTVQSSFDYRALRVTI